MHNNDSKRQIDADLQSVFDQIFLTNASRTPGVINDQNTVLDILLKYSNANFSLTYWHWESDDNGVGSGVAQILDPSGKSNVSFNLISAEQQFQDIFGGTLNWSLAYQADQLKANYTIFPAGSVLPIGADGNVNFVAPVGVTLFTDGYIGNPGNELSIWRTSLSHLVKINTELTLRTEAGFENQKLTASEQKNFGPGILDGSETVVDGTLTDVTGTENVYLKATSRDINYFSVQAEWQLNDHWSLNIGARYDDSDFDHTFTPRGALIWSDNDNWTSKLIFGSAFRAPSVTELYMSNNPSTIGNPQLSEENIDNFELIIDWQTNENWFVSLALFHYQAEDLIEYVPDPFLGGDIAQNFGGQEGKGGELQLNAQLNEEFGLSAHYAWIDIDFDNTTKAIDYPRKQSYVSLNWQISEQWRFHARYKHIADRERATADLRNNLKDYGIAQLYFSYLGLANNTTLSLSINNAFDKNGLEPSPQAIPEDYPVIGRQLVVELQQRY